MRITYKDDKGETHTITADYCHGTVPAYSNTFYWTFRNKGSLVAQVTKEQIIPEHRGKVKTLYGRPFLERVTKSDVIIVTEWDYDCDTDDTMWEINYLGRSAFLAEDSTHVTLSILNNKPRRFRGDLESALRHFFPTNTIKIHYPVRTTRVVCLEPSRPKRAKT